MLAGGGYYGVGAVEVVTRSHRGAWRHAMQAPMQVNEVVVVPRASEPPSIPWCQDPRAPVFLAPHHAYGRMYAAPKLVGAA